MKAKTKTTIKLAEDIDFSTVDQLFEYMVETYINGQFTPCKNLFFELTKECRKSFLIWCNVNEIDSKVYNFYFNLL